MAAVDSARLYEGHVSVDGSPVVAGTQAELNRRRIRARGVDRPEQVGHGRASATGAVLRNRLAVVGARGIVDEQGRRVRLPAAIPGCRPLQRQPGDEPGNERSLNTLDEEVLTIGVVENVADQP